MTSITRACDAVMDSEVAAGDVRVETRPRLARSADGAYHVWIQTRTVAAPPITGGAVAFDIIEGDR